MMIEVLKDELDGFVSNAVAIRILGLRATRFWAYSNAWYMEGVRFLRVGGHYYLYREDVERAAARRATMPMRRGRRRKALSP